MMDARHPALPISRLWEQAGLARVSYDLPPLPESDQNLRLMRVIEEPYMAYSCGRRFSACLEAGQVTSRASASP